MSLRRRSSGGCAWNGARRGLTVRASTLGEAARAASETLALPLMARHFERARSMRPEGYRVSARHVRFGVKSGKAQTEQSYSGLPAIADLQGRRSARLRVALQFSLLSTPARHLGAASVVMQRAFRCSSGYS